MSAEIIDGKKIAAEIRQRLKEEIAADTHEDLPVLAVVLVGENPASQIYMRNKKKAAEEIGMGCEVVEFAESIGENALLHSLEELNENLHINGIIVQQPLPSQINLQKVLEAILPEKDVDGFSPYNAGLLQIKDPSAIVAATPKAVLTLLQKQLGDLSGKHAVIIGRSNIVGKPLALLLLNHDCTVTIAHSKTKNLSALCQEADILVCATGKAKMVKKDWVKKGAVVIDVGINRLENGKLCGDVDFDEVQKHAAAITPVPGGVGPMTIAMLLENTWEAFKKQKNQEKTCHCGHHHDCCCHSHKSHE